MNTKLHYYFAYGMNTDPGQMALRTGKPIPVGYATLPDNSFRFAIHADVYPDDGGIVHGVLWLLNDDQLDHLDKREGYPHYYNRSVMTVHHDGKPYDAWVYWMNPGNPTSPPYQDYVDMLTRGYRHFGVPLRQIDNALRESWEVEDRLLPLNHITIDDRQYTIL